MKITLLNHAAVIIEVDDVKLLCDPWYFGSAFEDGWGLRFDNPKALELSKDCTHLWISHFHQDHFHIPTLKKLMEVNPDIIMYGNHSFNFQLDSALKRAGVKHIEPIYERKEIKLSDTVSITRYPTTGIDNFLIIKSSEGTVMNFNDCKLPKRTRKSLAKKIGKIDVMLNNYNHANKLLEHPLPSDEKIKKMLKENFMEKNDSFDPDYIIPFASYHYYRAGESQGQNSSMMKSKELWELDDRVLHIELGDTVEFDTDMNPHIHKCTYNIERAHRSIAPHEQSYSIEELTAAAKKFCKNLRKGFLHLTFWVPTLHIKISDLDKVVGLNLNKGLITEGIDADDYHIIAHSDSLHRWWNKMYGTDSFWVGAHFDLNTSNMVPIKWQFLIALLTENKLDLRSMIRMVLSPSGLKFLYSRREEIWAILLGRKFTIGKR